ncbi:MAG TPA: glucose 1-dehydrogenase [Stellaceae bacterium]|nr:glucose 1-dehydrogenase [Stellaceae bacterium]
MSADFSLAGKRALVTGASRGLGAHFAEVLAKAGADVALLARDGAAVGKTAAAITQATGRRAIAVAGDVTMTASVRAAFDRAETALGPLDILVNNAGIAVSKPLLEHDEADWDRVLDTNLKGAWLMAREFAARRIADKRGGRIVNLASLLAFRTARNVPEYAAAKAGLTQLTRVLALELARYGIGVNALAPGYFETDMSRAFLKSEAGQAVTARIPLGRTGMAADLDGALLLLVSPAGNYITGAVIPVDGGHLVASI